MSLTIEKPLSEELLSMAAEKGDATIVAALLSAGADPHAQDSRALRCSAWNGHSSCVKLLLDAGADVHALDDWSLYGAVVGEHSDTVRILLDAGANPLARNGAALSTAFQKNQNSRVEIEKMLRDSTTKPRSTPLVPAPPSPADTNKAPPAPTGPV